jgi:hypothetical protein
MASTEQKRKLLKAKIAVALQDELGRVPKETEIDQVFLLARVLYKAGAQLRVGGGVELYLKQRFKRAVDPGQSEM